MTPQELAERMKSDIIDDVNAGIVPASVDSFSALHDYTDANMYGGTEELLEMLEADSASDEEAMDKLCAIMNPAMDIINAWIKSGGIAEALRTPPTHN